MLTKVLTLNIQLKDALLKEGKIKEELKKPEDDKNAL